MALTTTNGNQSVMGQSTARELLSPMRSQRAQSVSKHEQSLITRRANDKTAEAVDVLYEPPAVGRQITWMGGDGERVIKTVDQSFDYKHNEELRKAARKARARSIRETTAFVDEVQRALTYARGGEQFDAQEALSKSHFERRKFVAQRARNGELYVSAYDGSAHELEDIASYNGFVRDRMYEVMDDEVRREAEGDLLSIPGNSVMLSQSEIGASQAAMKHSTRRPDDLPDLERWVTDIPQDEAGRKSYNEEARLSARSLMGYKCFRKCDFAKEFKNIQAFEEA